MDILNPPKFVPHGMDHYQHLKVQCLDTSDEAIKLSLKGNPEIEKDDIVEETSSGGDRGYRYGSPESDILWGISALSAGATQINIANSLVETTYRWSILLPSVKSVNLAN